MPSASKCKEITFSALVTSNHLLHDIGALLHGQKKDTLRIVRALSSGIRPLLKEGQRWLMERILSKQRELASGMDANRRRPTLASSPIVMLGGARKNLLRIE